MWDVPRGCSSRSLAIDDSQSQPFANLWDSGEPRGALRCDHGREAIESLRVALGRILLNIAAVGAR